VTSCELPITGSCLEPGYSCIDYTDADVTAAEASCLTSSYQSWFALPCSDHFNSGCLFGTPGAPGCRVLWRATGGNFFVHCVEMGGTIILPTQ